MKAQQRRVFWLMILLFGISCSVLLPAVVQAQERRSAISAAATAAPSTITVGDPVEVTVTVSHPAGSRVNWPALAASWGTFEVYEQRAASVTTNEDGSQTSTQLLLLTLWTPGEHTTPPWVIRVAAAGGEIVEVTVPPVTVTVVSVLRGNDLALRDLKPQAALDTPLPWPWLLAGLGSLLLSAATLAWAWRRWDGAATAVSTPIVDERPPYQVALDELTRIEGLDLPAQTKFKEHYTLTTAALRRYLETAFGLPALDRTTAEMRAALAQSPIAQEQQRAVLAMLADADLVKFAKWEPDLRAARALPQQAKSFVLETLPAGDGVSEE